jgi:hypothetical protein
MNKQAVARAKKHEIETEIKKGGESQVAFHLPGWVGFVAGSLFGWYFRV